VACPHTSNADQVINADPAWVVDRVAPKSTRRDSDSVWPAGEPTLKQSQDKLLYSYHIE